MIANNFQRGDTVPCRFTPVGQGAVTLNVKTQSTDIEVLTIDVTHTGTGGDTAKIGGKRDARGTVTASVDLDAPPYGQPTPNIREGVTGIIQKGISPSKFIQIPVIIKKVHYEQAIENEIKYSFDWEMNVLAGTFVYPAT